MTGIYNALGLVALLVLALVAVYLIVAWRETKR